MYSQLQYLIDDVTFHPRDELLSCNNIFRLNLHGGASNPKIAEYCAREDSSAAQGYFKACLNRTTVEFVQNPQISTFNVQRFK